MTTKNANPLAYSVIRAEARKPVADRQAIVKGRNGMKVPRRYELDKKQIEELRKNAGSDFPNPFRAGGVYHGATQALINLGIDKGHTFKDVKSEMQKVMSKIERQGTDAWTLFADRPAKKDAKAPKDLNGRIMQTFTVLQRLTGNHRYGLKIAQLLACIDILAGKDNQPLYMLHTGFKQWNLVKPTNDLKGLRRKSKTAVKPKAKAKTAPKAKATAKPKAKVVEPVLEPVA